MSHIYILSLVLVNVLPSLATLPDSYNSEFLIEEQKVTLPSPPPCEPFYNLGEYRPRCCNNTGMCDSSDCQVFGLHDSGKTNCPGALGSGDEHLCREIYCNYTMPCEHSNDHTEHCFGYVRCHSGGTNCSYYNDLCLEDGNSNNLKICGAVPMPSTSASPSGVPSPTPSDVPSASTSASPSDDRIKIKETSPYSDSPSPSPVPSPGCFCAGVDDLCQKAEDSWVDNGYTNRVTFPECHNPAFVADSVNEWGSKYDQGPYGCHVDSTNCNLIVCDSFVPDAAFADLPTCPSV